MFSFYDNDLKEEDKLSMMELFKNFENLDNREDMHLQYNVEGKSLKERKG